MKKLGALALALTLASSLSVGALAADEALLISANPNAYAIAITVNGTVLDTKGTPASTGIPMRLVAEANRGSAGWYAEEDLGAFYMEGCNVNVTFSTGAVTVNDAVVAGVTAEVKNGVTFLPLSVFEGVAGYTVTTAEDGAVTIVTPNNDPMVKLAYQILEETEMSRGMKNSNEELFGTMGIHEKNFEAITAFSPMMISADTVIIGKLSKDADKAEAKADLKARQDATIKNFEQYLPGPLELAKNGKIVESNGYMMLIISPDTEKAIALFEAFAKSV